jgi:hypothetical protein
MRIQSVLVTTRFRSFLFSSCDQSRLVRSSRFTSTFLLRRYDLCMTVYVDDAGLACRLWRTQIHFLRRDDKKKDTFFAELPGW